MTKQPTRLRAIDLYSGIGGWSLGLRLADVEVVASYERWGPANETNFKNNLHQAQTVDIRRLSLDDLPPDIDLVVGSPPCTQFSFSNRGGGGDIADGLEDIRQFLRIVDHLKPRAWAMENVPRVAAIIDAEFKAGGVLAQFEHLGCEAHIVDMAEYGLPQRRRRCIAGNFDIELLRSYRSVATARTLGSVVSALAADPIIDPLFGVTLPRSEVSEHIEEDLLSAEEVRINRANKTTHTVYNAMPFPDPLDRSVRTITATCTRVSRESIVVETRGDGAGFRRLTPRERASLQGFPITFQFYGSSYGQKLRMIGNAVPPAFAYLMGHALQQRAQGNVPALCVAAKDLKRPTPTPVDTLPDRAGGRFRADRTFRFAIPSLQLKSGVRFELRNRFDDEMATWEVAFYFGNSKAIHSLELDRPLARLLAERMPKSMRLLSDPLQEEIKQFIASADIVNMQAVWSHKGPGGTRAFMVLDKIDEIGGRLARALASQPEKAAVLVAEAINHGHGPQAKDLAGRAKLSRNAPLILAGLVIGSAVNPLLDIHVPRRGIGTKDAAVRRRG